MEDYDDGEKTNLKKARRSGKKFNSGLSKYFIILIIGLVLGIILQTLFLGEFFSFSSSLKTCETEKTLVDNQLVTCLAKLDGSSNNISDAVSSDAIIAEPSSVDENSFVEIQ